MAKITITDSDGETHEISGDIGAWPSHDAVVEAHGWDPDVVDWSVDDPDAEIEELIRNAQNLKDVKDALTEGSVRLKGRRP